MNWVVTAALLHSKEPDVGVWLVLYRGEATSEKPSPACQVVTSGCVTEYESPIPIR